MRKNLNHIFARKSELFNEKKVTLHLLDNTEENSE